MNPILASAESSAVVATIRESKQQNPWVYNEAGRITTPHAMQLLNVAVSSGTVAASRTFSFDIPKNGQLQQVWLKMTMPGSDIAGTTDGIEVKGKDDPAEGTPVAGNTEGYGALGLLNLIDEVRLESSGRVHEQLSRFQILQRLSDLPLAQRTAAQSAYRMGTQPPDNLAYNPCLILPFFFSKDGARYGIDSDFQEPLRVVVKLSDCEILYRASPAGYSVTAPTNCTAICEYRQWDDATKQQVISQNYSGGMLSRVVRLSGEEAVHTHTSPATGNGVTTLDLKESDVITGLYVVVECPNIGSAANYTVGMQQGKPLEIDEITLKFSGQEILSVPGEFLEFYGRDFGRPATHGAGDCGTVTRDDNSNMRFVYKISFDCMGSALGNAVALREISRAQLTINYKPAAASTVHNVHIGYEKVSFLTVASSTGRTNLSISS